jgi:hypothetical protein
MNENRNERPNLYEQPKMVAKLFVLTVTNSLV